MQLSNVIAAILSVLGVLLMSTALIQGGYSPITAISHQSFTRFHHNRPHYEQLPLTQPTVAAAPAAFGQQAIWQREESPRVVVRAHSDSSTPVVASDTHTPAHLTYAATPVVYQMLPMIKPVRSISFDSLLPSPRNAHGWL